MQLQAIAALKPAMYAGTPSFLKMIVEKAIDTGADRSSIRRALVSAEPHEPAVGPGALANDGKVIEDSASTTWRVALQSSAVRRNMTLSVGA